MPREFTRSRRIEEAIQRLLGEAVTSKVRDPRLTGIVFTEVRISRDLAHARVYYTRLQGGSSEKEIAAVLRSATGFLRSSLARGLRVRHVPELRFIPDEAQAKAQALDQLIDRAVDGNRPTRPEGRPPEEIPR